MKLFPATPYQLSLAKRLLDFRVEVYAYSSKLGVMLSQAAALAWLHASPMFEQITAEGIQLVLRSGIRMEEVFVRVGGVLAESVAQVSDILDGEPEADALAAKGHALAADLDCEVQHMSAELARGARHAAPESPPGA
jgi:hypothetical protein